MGEVAVILVLTVFDELVLLGNYLVDWVFSDKLDLLPKLFLCLFDSLDAFSLNDALQSTGTNEGRAIAADAAF